MVDKAAFAVIVDVVLVVAVVYAFQAGEGKGGVLAVDGADVGHVAFQYPTR